MAKKPKMYVDLLGSVRFDKPTQTPQTPKPRKARMNVPIAELIARQADFIEDAVKGGAA